MPAPKHLVVRAGQGLDLLRQPGAARRLLAAAALRATDPSFADLPGRAAVKLAYDMVMRRAPSTPEADAARERFRTGAAARYALLDELQSSYAGLPLPVALRLGYTMLIRREPDAEGLEWVNRQLESGAMDRWTFLDWLRGTGDFVRAGYRLLGPSLHASRCQFVRSLPRARRILDLGGTDLGHTEGAFVHMGYPYDFSELVVVDLLPEARHPLYRRPAVGGTVSTERGPVRYEYHSMTDLSRYEAGSFDLVYSGQTFEHVTEAEGDLVLAEVRRVLRPGGVFALDTPNARVCRLQQPELIDPDHKIEYCGPPLEAKLATGGFCVEQRWGLNWGGPAVGEGRFSAEDTARNYGVFAEADECYLLAYVCRAA